jgi:hypothetical protein
MKYIRSKNEVKLTIRGINVTIKQGDIFKSDGWRLIPFNEYYDTQVDDVVIARNSLNGKFIESLSDDDREELKQKIAVDDNSPLTRHYSPDDTRTRYDLTGEGVKRKTARYKLIASPYKPRQAWSRFSVALFMPRCDHRERRREDAE